MTASQSETTTAFESPFLFQLAGQHVRRLGAVDTLNAVVTGHHRPGLRLTHGDLERGQVNFVERPFIDVGIGPHPLGFDVVGDEVLERRSDSPGLHAVDVGGTQLA